MQDCTISSLRWHPKHVTTIDKLCCVNLHVVALLLGRVRQSGTAHGLAQRAAEQSAPAKLSTAVHADQCAPANMPRPRQAPALLVLTQEGLVLALNVS